MNKNQIIIYKIIKDKTSKGTINILHQDKIHNTIHKVKDKVFNNNKESIFKIPKEIYLL